MPDLTRANVRFEGMKVMTNPGQVTLESPQAELPEGEFQLFIMPQKVKSGYRDADLISYDEDEDDSEAISWEDEDWSVEDPESGNFLFKTERDLAIARSKRAFALLDKALEALTQVKSRPVAPLPGTSNDPILNSLRAEAAKLQKNMEIFG